MEIGQDPGPVEAFLVGRKAWHEQSHTLKKYFIEKKTSSKTLFCVVLTLFSCFLVLFVWNNEWNAYICSSITFLKYFSSCKALYQIQKNRKILKIMFWYIYEHRWWWYNPIILNYNVFRWIK